MRISDWSSDVCSSDLEGALIANAPHIPVHLGSMGDSIRTIIEARGDARDGRGMKPGDVYVLNAPYRGGTHLPDITVIMPVFVDEDDNPAWYEIGRAQCRVRVCRSV